MNEIMQGTYTRLRSGEWGLRIEGCANTDDPVRVTKRNGSSEIEFVGRVIWRKAAVIEIIRRLGYDGWRDCEPVYTLVSQGQHAINKGNWGWGEECFEEAAEYLVRYKPYVRKVGARRARHVAGMPAFCEEGVEFKPRKSIS